MSDKQMKARPIKRQQRSMQQAKVTPPRRQYLQHWAEVCRYLDAQPRRCIRAPFPDDPPMSYPLLRNMARFKLVRHRNSDCTWQLNQRWQAILNRLAQGITDQEVRQKPAPQQEAAPFVVDYGVDTMYVNVLAEEMPAKFLSRCRQLKDQAQSDYKPISTPWQFGGIPLVLLPNGKGVSDSGGVSWGFIFRNEWVEIRLRTAPVSGIVGMVHFLAECLWLNGPQPALDLMTKALKAMWADATLFDQVSYQLSQIHLCADIAHFPMTLDYLPRLVTRSVKRAIHVPSRDDRALDDSWLHGDAEYSDDDDELYYGSSPPEWEEEIAIPDIYEEAEADLDLEDDEDDLDEDDEEEEGTSDDDEEDLDEDESQWDADGGAIHWRGQRIEGIGFSPAGALSAAWYDKILEERKAKLKKPWMREIHIAGGWQPEMCLTRLEYRHKRPVMNELEVALGHDKGHKWFDDPYVALEHLGDLWAFDVGLPPEHDQVPDVTYRGWMRLVVPDAHDSNRARWATDPMWEVVQRVPFSQELPKPLKRVKQVHPDLDQIDAQIRGYFISRAMLRESYMPGPASLSRELEHFDEQMREWEQRTGRDFGEEVRERARMAGKRVPYKAPMVLPTKRRQKQTEREVG
jgi:hypothetical protein